MVNPISVNVHYMIKNPCLKHTLLIPYVLFPTQGLLDLVVSPICHAFFFSFFFSMRCIECIISTIVMGVYCSHTQYYPHTPIPFHGVPLSEPVL